MAAVGKSTAPNSFQACQQSFLLGVVAQPALSDQPVQNPDFIAGEARLAAASAKAFFAGPHPSLLPETTLGTGKLSTGRRPALPRIVRPQGKNGRLEGKSAPTAQSKYRLEQAGPDLSGGGQRTC